MKVYGDWRGFPGHWLDDPTSRDGKRWIATHYGWDQVKTRVREECGNRCECGQYDPYLDTHHRFGRGGGKRDDRITLPDGTRNLVPMCRTCHDEAKIERRVH